MSPTPQSQPKVPPGTVVVLAREDAGEILTLQRAAYVTEALAHRDLSLPPLHQSLEELRAELSAEAVVALGVRLGGRLIGAVRVEKAGEVASLGRLIVAPDLQGQGIGGRLLAEAERVHPGMREVRLFTGEHSAANLRFYERKGYVETGRTPAGDYSLVWLAKPLH